MAENVTPVTLQVKDFAEREVIMEGYNFIKPTIIEVLISGCPGAA